MAKKKNLERAIVLGLLLSTSFCGSAWADVILIEGENAYPEGLTVSGTTETYNGEGKNITMNPHNSTKGAGGAFGFWVHGYDDGALISNDAHATINVGSISIDTRNYAALTDINILPYLYPPTRRYGFIYKNISHQPFAFTQKSMAADVPCFF